MSGTKVPPNVEKLKAFGINYKVVGSEPEVFEISSEDDSGSKGAEKSDKAANRTVAPNDKKVEKARDLARYDPPFNRSDFRVGECLEKKIELCSWEMVYSYPRYFIGKTNQPRAQPFFDTILEGRVWDFFYLYDPEKANNPPRLLVPSLELEAFLESINRELGIALKIPPGYGSFFYLEFDDPEMPRPRYLGRSRGPNFEGIGSWPAIHKDDVDAFNKATLSRKAAWKALWTTMRPLFRPGRHKNKEQKRMQRKAERETMMSRAQACLHVKGSPPIDVVLVCMDVEAIEVAPNPVSEIGISILDVKCIKAIEPGPGGSEWWPFIESHHLRIQEYASEVNHRYVKGCPDKFGFGRSEFCSAVNTANAVDDILAPHTKDRAVVFVAHEALCDMKHLSQIGVEVSGMGKYKGHLDTKIIHQAWTNNDDGRSLESVLNDLGIRSWNLHNAGNDAAYTLRALVSLAIEDIRKDKALEKGERYVPALLMSPLLFASPVKAEDEKKADEKKVDEKGVDE